MVEVLHPGFYSSIQDPGRHGYAEYGVPRSGPMDRGSAFFANQLLGNEINAAVLEFALQGPELLFPARTIIALTGTNVFAFIHGRAFPANKAVELKPGDVLSFEPMHKGNYGYIAVYGGFQTPVILGSRSQYRGVTNADSIQKGEQLPVVKMKAGTQSIVREVEYSYSDSDLLEVSPGPEFALLSDIQKRAIRYGRFRIGRQNNRMAFHLAQSIGPHDFGILSSPVLPGTVQYLPSGKLIVLMRDCQTTGGYPRILQLAEESIDMICQKRPGEEVKIKLLE